VRDASRRGIPHLLVIPCLLLTFMFGPIGFMAYYALRAIGAGRFTPALVSTSRSPHPSDR
jgi:ABA DEFICIENT 4-like